MSAERLQGQREHRTVSGCGPFSPSGQILGVLMGGVWTCARTVIQCSLGLCGPFFQGRGHEIWAGSSPSPHPTSCIWSYLQVPWA